MSRFKSSARIAAYAFFIVWAICLSSCSNNDVSTPQPPPEDDSLGTAILISGASARIGQEFALLERLHETGELDKTEFIGGVSSGGILAIALNALLDKKNPFKWEDIKNVLFSLHNDSLFVNNNNSIPLNVERMRNFLGRLTARMGIRSLSKDLTFPTVLTTVDKSNKKLETISNISLLIPSITDDPVDALMSTSAIPFLFPEVKINDIAYEDGGSQEVIPIRAMLEYQKKKGKFFRKIILVTVQENKGDIDWDTELTAAGFTGLGKSLIILALSASSVKFSDVKTELMGIKDTATRLLFAPRTVVYQPNIPDLLYTPLLDFSKGKDQYDRARVWALQNKPISLEEFERIP